MDDLNDNPQEIAEDIIKQATGLSFKEEATQRIIRIITAYQKQREELEALEKQKQTEADVICDGPFAWRMKGNQRVGKPCCAYCYNKNKKMIELIDCKVKGQWQCKKMIELIDCKVKGQWQCPECDRYHYDDSFKMPMPRRSPRSPMQF